MEDKFEAVEPLEKGQIVEIKPSMAFLDIPRGEVQIIRIAKYEDVCEEYADPEGIVKDEPEARDRNWIVYCYTLNNPRDLWRQFYCLDEETFRYHIGNPEIF